MEFIVKPQVQRKVYDFHIRVVFKAKLCVLDFLFKLELVNGYSEAILKGGFGSSDSHSESLGDLLVGRARCLVDEHFFDICNYSALAVTKRA